MKKIDFFILMVYILIIAGLLICKNTFSQENYIHLEPNIVTMFGVEQHPESMVCNQPIKIDIINDSIIKQDGKNWYLVLNYWENEEEQVTNYDLLYLNDTTLIGPQLKYIKGLLTKDGFTIYYQSTMGNTSLTFTKQK